MRRLSSFIAALVLMVALPGFAQAEKRVALVIGNGTYDTVGTLINPPKDARLMTTTLRDLGFEVIERIDANQKSHETRGS